MIKVTLGVIVLALTVVLGGSPAWGGEAALLSDAELEQVYGGQDPDEVLVIEMPQTCGGTCSQSIGTGAFAGASAMIIVNSVASIVSAQVNMNVSINGDAIANQTNIGFSNATIP